MLKEVNLKLKNRSQKRVYSRHYDDLRFSLEHVIFISLPGRVVCQNCLIFSLKKSYRFMNDHVAKCKNQAFFGGVILIRGQIRKHDTGPANQQKICPVLGICSRK